MADSAEDRPSAPDNGPTSPAGTPPAPRDELSLLAGAEGLVYLATRVAEASSQGPPTMLTIRRCLNNTCSELGPNALVSIHGLCKLVQTAAVDTRTTRDTTEAFIKTC
jgi:hypothetical protein